MESLNLNRCCNELLDMGKRNRLLYFSEGGASLRVFSSLSEEKLFERFKSGKAFSPFPLDSLQKRFGITNEQYNSDKEIRDRLISEAKNLCLKSGAAEKTLLLLPKKAGLFPALRRILQSASLCWEERGINTLYLALGMLNWKENPASEERVRSPLFLLPVTLKKEASDNSFSLFLNEADSIRFNSTLFYKLSVDFGIKMDEFDEGTDTFQGYLSRFEAAISGFSDWRVEQSDYLGLFAFSKLDMYRDLSDHAEKVLSNPLVQALFDPSKAKLPEEAHPTELPLHNVVDADSSQAKAIEEAKSGNSFLLQGPPGTGKSQTITNIIAEALYDGKKVLFVSEKKAALDVVYRKMQEARLDDFCLALHGSKASKKEVLGEISRVLNLDPSSLSQEAKEKLDRLKEEKESLDAYASSTGALCKPLRTPVYQVLGKASLYQDIPSPAWRFPKIEKKGESFLRKALENLSLIQGEAERLGRELSAHPYFGLKEEEFTYEGKLSFEEALGAFLEDEGALNEKAKALSELGFDMSCLCKRKTAYRETEKGASIPFYDSGLFLRDGIPFLASEIKKIEEKEKEIEEAEEALLNLGKEEVLSFPSEELYARFKGEYSSPFRGFKSAYRKDMKRLKRISREKKLTYPSALSFLEAMELLRGKREEKERLFVELNSHLKEKKVQGEKDLRDLASSLETASSFGEGFPFFKTAPSLSQFQVWKERIKGLHLQEDDFVSVSRLSAFFDPNRFDFESAPWDALVEKAKKMKESPESYGGQIKLNRACSEAREKDYLPFVELYLSSDLPLSALPLAFQKCFYQQWAYRLIDLDPVLKGASRRKLEQTLESFQKDDRLSFLVSQSQIREKCYQGIPVAHSRRGGLVNSFNQEANKKRNIPSIRSLMKKYGSLIQAVKPCFMMSPLTVSTYLDEGFHFDLVVFDEASQIFPWDAIGALYRSDQAVIVGDAMQMPPTSFFLADLDKGGEEGQEGGNAVSSFESILDFAGALPRFCLKWHYRSKSEDLISFSNSHYYNGDLVFFPSAREKQPGFGVDFHFVENGVYDRRRGINEEEAKSVVDLICEDARNYPSDSLGVVCMNLAQQEAIQSLLEERIAEDPTLLSYCSAHAQEGIFVKNLETVQGDERDRIILSIGYGKDKDGRFLHNFGPLNKEGGERRLNVAITRAKYNVQVVSSLHFSDLKEGGLNSLGAKYLKEYLRFAELGGEERKKEESKEFGLSSPLEQSVAKVLKELGYAFRCGVGSSLYRIDLGVKEKGGERFVLALECDGESYHSSSSTRDRDRLREQVLKGQGWSFYRIWSTDWFLFPEQEKKLLQAKIEESSQGVKRESEQSLEKPSFESKKQRKEVRLEDAFEKYRFLYSSPSNQKINSSDSLSLYQVISLEARKIVSLEQPIREEGLLLELAYATGRSKITPPIREAFSLFYREYGRFEMEKHRDGDSYYYCFPDCKDFSLRIGDRRGLSNIPGIEIENGLLRIASLEGCLLKEDLIRDFCLLLGYKKISASMSSILAGHLASMQKQGLLLKGEEGYLTLPEGKEYEDLAKKGILS